MANPYVVQQAKDAKTKVSTADQAVYQLAECYRKLNYLAKAQPYYARVAGNPAYPLAAYYNGITLRATEKYDSALAVLENFTAGYTTEDAYLANARKEIANLRFIQQETAPGKVARYVVNKAAANQQGATYAPAWAGTQLVVTSTKPDSSVRLSKNESPFNNKLYTAGRQGLVKLSIPNNDQQQYGVASFTADGNTAYLTRWKNVSGKNVSAIYRSRRADSGWSQPELLDSSINLSGSNARQPFVTPDGKTLYFASDRPGGMGGNDLYKVALDGAAIPVNLGAAINTAGDEEAPFVTGSRLVFASNGRVGMGGYDLYYSVLNNGTWGTAVNFGSPVNSVKDDIYYTAQANGTTGLYLSSDRSSDCCLQLFEVIKLKSNKTITGRVVACGTTMPLGGTTVQVTDSATGTAAFTLVTDADGKYTVTIPDYKAYSALAAKTGYAAGQALYFNGPADTEADTLFNADLCLTPLADTPQVNPPADVLILNTVYFDFDRSNLTAESKHTLDEVVAVLKQNPDMVIEVNGNTDAEGSDEYNFELSMKRAKICFDYLVKHGIKIGRLQLKASGESNPVAPNSLEGKDNPAGRKLNRRTEFKLPAKK